MDDLRDAAAGGETRWTSPPLPATSAEYITVLSHYHRAEMGRMAGWRDRIDRTTNWAITGVAAMLSLSLSTPTSHHGVLIFAMILVQLLLLIEARRYRFFDVYRGRVRKLEKHYFAQILDPMPDPDTKWGHLIGEDLRRPKFMISTRAAMSRRLRRNYIWMFMVLLLAWVLKISTPKLQDGGAVHDVAGSLAEIVRNATFGPLPGWLVVAGVVMFYVWLGYLALLTDPDEKEHGEVHV
ncbi:DUF2270 domain-containing protein [Phyllobacterium sp. SYP-B3895]|uniref:DUF2270 domain-containing protein n=1 Tax=Phyllobacterium sp. SYP-B3895 TaxID=2663240 RepID=UPI001299917E|nr:DUF2270 domain-containing protein [Phyllobacterium sp. SYP-B3895]MRG55090.1 DUF2270 domain-containing protein [Phyllobacterium sp. SYP-B3895]